MSAPTPFPGSSSDWLYGPRRRHHLARRHSRAGACASAPWDDRMQACHDKIVNTMVVQA